jgi:hypothetical protein
MVNNNYYLVFNTDHRHCLKHLNPTEDDRSYVLSSAESNSCNVSECRVQFFQTKASALLMASRDKLSTFIIYVLFFFVVQGPAADATDAPQP